MDWVDAMDGKTQKHRANRTLWTGWTQWTDCPLFADQKDEGSSPPRRTVKRPVSNETGLFLPPKYLNQPDRAIEVSKYAATSVWRQPSRRMAIGRCGFDLA